MSTPDDPTRRMPSDDPKGPPPGGTREREVVRDAPDWRAQLADQLRTIRAGLIGTALIALVALGLGVYLLATRDDDDGADRNAASAAQVRQLEQRTDRLESRLGNRAGEGDVEEVQQNQAQIADRLDALEEQVGDDDAQQLQQAVERLSGQLEQLSRRVDRLEEEQQDQQ